MLQAGGFELENPCRHGIYASGCVYLRAVASKQTCFSASAWTGSGSQHNTAAHRQCLSGPSIRSGSGATAGHVRGAYIAVTRRNTELAVSICGSGGRGDSGSGGTSASRQAAAHMIYSAAICIHTGVENRRVYIYCGGRRLLLYINE